MRESGNGDVRLATLLVTRRGFDVAEDGPSAKDVDDDLLGDLVPHEGLGVVVPVLDIGLDGFDEGRHARERPPRSRRSVSSLNHRSTRLSQRELVAMKCRCRRERLGWASQRCTSGA